MKSKPNDRENETQRLNFESGTMGLQKLDLKIAQKLSEDLF